MLWKIVTFVVKTLNNKSEIVIEDISMTDVKELVAKLLEDARRLQEIEPNAGTEQRIKEAEAFLQSQ